MVEDWLWLGRDLSSGPDAGARARTFIELVDEQDVARAFHLQDGERQWLTSAQAEDQRLAWSEQRPGRDFGDPPFQIRILPLGEWSLVLEDDQILRVTSTAPVTSANVRWLSVDFTLATQLGIRWHDGGRLSSFGAVLGSGDGYLRSVADRIGFDADGDVGHENTRLLAAVAEDRGIPVVDPAVLQGPLLTISGG